MPNGTYGGVRGARDYPLLDFERQNFLKNLFHNFIQYIDCFIFHVLCDVGVDVSSDFRVGMTNPVRDCF